MAARGEARADVEVSTLVVPAWRLRWRAPELALVLGERAVALASARRDEVDRLRAEALVVFASNRMGRGVRTADRALDALKAAESESEQETAWRLRVELADSARSVGAPLTGFAAVRPVLEAENVPPGLRAAALVQASECLVSVGRGDALSQALDEADRLYQADPLLDHDTTLLHRALLRAASAGQHRRWGDLQAATAACRDGLDLLDRLKEAESDNGQVRGRLTVELVCALLDLNKPGEASEAGTPLLERPVRAPSASTTGWLRLALATRVHLPAGRVDQARDLLRDAADSAERHQLDLLLSESLLALAHVHEVGGDLTEALANLRSAHAAERRRARAVYAVRARLAAEFSGVHRPPAGSLHDELAALLRTGTQTAPPPADTALAPEAKQQLRQWRPVQMHRNEGVRVKRSRRAAEDMTAEGISAARAHAADRWRLVQPFGSAEALDDAAEFAEVLAEEFGAAQAAEPHPPAHPPAHHQATAAAATAAAIQPAPTRTPQPSPPGTQTPQPSLAGTQVPPTQPPGTQTPPIPPPAIQVAPTSPPETQAAQPQPSGTPAASTSPSGMQAASAPVSGAEAVQSQLSGTPAASTSLSGTEVAQSQLPGTQAALTSLSGMQAASTSLSGAQVAQPQLPGTPAAPTAPSGIEAAGPQLSGTQAASIAPSGTQSAQAQPFATQTPQASPTGPQTSQSQAPGSQAALTSHSGSQTTQPQAPGTGPVEIEGRPEHARSGQARPHSSVSPHGTPDLNQAPSGMPHPAAAAATTPAPSSANIAAAANAATDAGLARAEFNDRGTGSSRQAQAMRQDAAESAGGPPRGARHGAAAPTGDPASGVRDDSAVSVSVSAEGSSAAGRHDSSALGDRPAGVVHQGSATPAGGFPGPVRQNPAASAESSAGVARHGSAVPGAVPVDAVGKGSATLTGGSAVSANSPAGASRDQSVTSAGGFVGGTGAGLGGGGGFGIAQHGAGAPSVGHGGGVGSGDGGMSAGVSPGAASPGGGAAGVGRGPLAARDLESAVANQSVTSSGAPQVGADGGIGGHHSDIVGSGFSVTAADGGREIGAGQSGAASEVSRADAVGASPSTPGNETGERTVPAAGLIAAAGVVRSGRRRAAREATEGDSERSSGDHGSDPNVLDALKAAGLLDSQRTGGRRRARDAEEDAAVSVPTPEAEVLQAEPGTQPEAVPEPVQWRVEAPQRLRTEEPSIDMFDSPTMVQPAVRDDVPPVGLGAAFVKGPVIPTARVPDPPDFPPPPVPDFASPLPDFSAIATVPAQGSASDLVSDLAHPDAAAPKVNESTTEPRPEPDQVPVVPEPDQVPPVPVPDPVPSNPSPEVAALSAQAVESAPAAFGSTGFLSAADVEHDYAPVDAPVDAPVAAPVDIPTGVPAGVTTAAPVAPAEPAAPAADVPAAVAPVADTPVADMPVGDALTADAPTTDTPAADVPAEDPTKDPFVTAVVVGGKTIDLPAIVEPTPPALESPSATRASRRHKSDLSLAELLAEALVAYEDARREDEAAGRVDEDTVPITPVGLPPESAAETTAPIRRVEPAPRFDTWTLPES